MNHLTKRCGCGAVFALAHLKDRSSQCVACQRRDARGLNERRAWDSYAAKLVQAERFTACMALWLEWRCANDPIVYSSSGNPNAFVAKFGEFAFHLVAHRSGDWSVKLDWNLRDGIRRSGMARDLRTAQIQAERAAACMALCSYAAKLKGHVRRRNGGAARTQLGRATWRGADGKMFKVGVSRQVVGRPAIPQRAAPAIDFYTSCLRAVAADHENVMAMIESGSFVRAAIEWEED